MSVLSVPLGIPFARALATQVWEETNAAQDPQALAHMTFLLPTRRACRVMREVFVRLAAGKPCLLPRFLALGALEEDAGVMLLPQIAALPPAIAPLRQHLILLRLVLAKEKGMAPALAATHALIHFMQEMGREEIDWAQLDTLVPELFSDQWQVTLEFLKIVRQAWPSILAQEGLMDGSARMHTALDALADFWCAYPPKGPVIAAGSTGSHPSTARLLAAIARMPTGRVVLPGLDVTMSESDWGALTPTHPNWGMKHLLTAMEIERADVRPWPLGHIRQHTHIVARRALMRALMRPAQGEHETQNAQDISSQALEGLCLFTCKGPEEESTLVALLLRNILEDCGRTAMVVTPDRALAIRIRSIMTRWDVHLDDSAGTPLSETCVGQFLALIAHLGAYTPQTLPRAHVLALLHHPLCSTIEGGQDLELFWRKNKKDQDMPLALSLLESAFAPFMALCCPQGHCLEAWLDAHLRVAQNLAGGEDTLWRGTDGRAAAKLFEEALYHADAAPPLMTGAEYGALILNFMKDVSVRPPARSSHPRLQILGPLEARLMEADTVILAGLNEGVWPEEDAPNPWLSRPMRLQLGLSPAGRDVGLSAHDFEEHCAAPNVILTRARKIGGVPRVPSRWLVRLAAVLESRGLCIPEGIEPLSWAKALDAPARVRPASRPAPKPPACVRPHSISVTRVEEWLSNPYAIYARSILNLRALGPLESLPDDRAFGQALHEVMEHFAQVTPPTAAAFLALTKKIKNAPAFWSMRFARLAPLIERHESLWRGEKGAKPIALEAKGSIILKGAGGFTLVGRADRIDRLPSGGAVLIDYKSGGDFSEKKLKAGLLPQLPLEALMVEEGGFLEAGFRAGVTVEGLSYWVLSGSGGKKPPFFERKIYGAEAVAEAVQIARAGLVNLIATFADENTPYIARPRPAFVPRFDDYEHLARVKEWEDSGSV